MDAKLLLAPMAGVTSWPLRLLCQRMGADYTCTEMVSAMGYMCAKPQNEAYRELLYAHPEERNLACQLFGSDPSVMSEAAARITALGRFDSLDINMGCPARKIVASGEGSAMLKTPELAARVMEAVKHSTTLPVTLKTRLGFDGNSMNALELAIAARELGFKWVAVHGRTREQQYGGRADWEAIARIREAAGIPIIANGDLFEPEDAVNMARDTGCDMLMVGRGAMGNPWLFRGAREALAGKPITPISTHERLQTALLQAEWLISLKGERIGINEMRTHVGHYVAGIRGASAFRRRLNGAKTLAELKGLLDELEADSRVGE